MENLDLVGKSVRGDVLHTAQQQINKYCNKCLDKFIFWLKVAAVSNCPNACHLLAFAFRHGIGTPTNIFTSNDYLGKYLKLTGQFDTGSILPREPVHFLESVIPMEKSGPTDFEKHLNFLRRLKADKVIKSGEIN